jgi:uroporphyrinogen III methyltransferase/synthase
MGPGTAEELIRYGHQADLVPEQFRAESLAEALASQAAGKRFLLARASRGREVLAERLAAAGGIVEQVVVYTSTDVERPSAEAAALLHAGKVDWITVTSSAIARSLARLFSDELRRAKLASISPVTSGTLRELGYEPAAEAAEYTLAGLTAAIADHR